MRQAVEAPAPRVKTAPAARTTRSITGMRLITLWLPEPWIQDINALIQVKMYPNRSEAIRTAVRDLIKKEAPAQ